MSMNTRSTTAGMSTALHLPPRRCRKAYCRLGACLRWLVGCYAMGLTLLLITPMLTHAAPNSTFGTEGTRVVYLSNKKNTTLVVNHTANAPILVQSWLTDSSGDSHTPFVITPPLYRPSGESNTLRIIKVGNAPASDHETLYYVHVRAVPGVTGSAGKTKQSGSTSMDNSISIPVTLNLKMFYRPSQLQAQASDAYTKLVLAKQGDKLLINNPTPFYLTLAKLSVNGSNLLKLADNQGHALLPPRSQQQYQLTGNSTGQVVYTTINDQGLETASVARQLP